MKIPVKKYTPDPNVVENINTVLGEKYSESDPIRVIAEEYQKLLAHHEEETKFIFEQLKIANKDRVLETLRSRLSLVAMVIQHVRATGGPDPANLLRAEDDLMTAIAFIELNAEEA